MEEKIKEILKKLIEENEFLVCKRVWSAWDFGNMSENDFNFVSEDDDCFESFLEDFIDEYRDLSND